jgi:hypothetical protein
MTPKLFLRNILSLSALEIFFLIFICGFFLPKFKIVSFYVSIPDILAVFFTLKFFMKGKINTIILSIFKFEITITFFFIFLLLINFIKNNTDYYSFFYVLRITSYIFASFYIIGKIKKNCSKIINLSIYIVGIYIFFYVSYILINIWGFSIDEIFYGYTKIRLKLPFEYSNTTSVPFGYLLSLIFVYIVSSKNVFKFSKFNSLLFLLAQLFTISRAATLSSVIFLIFKKNKIGYFFIPIFLYFIFLKTFSDGSLDKSSFDRVRFLIHSVDVYFNNLQNNFFGFGLSPNILFSNTDYYYFENIFSQSLMNGGILFVLIIITMYITFTYRMLFKMKYIYIPVLIGNLFGGFNLLSTISLPLYIMMVYHSYHIE